MRCKYVDFNGRYYIEVFSRRYYKQFGEVAAVVRDSNFDAPLSPASAQAKLAPTPGPSDTPSAPGSVPPPLVSDQEDEYDDEQAEQAAEAVEAEQAERASSDSSVASRSGEVGLRTVRHRRTASSVSAQTAAARAFVNSAAGH